MNVGLGDEALAFGGAARGALEAAGGDGLVQEMERAPDRRQSVVAPVLAQLGAWELDPLGDAEQLEAAAGLCRAVGHWAVPYPVAERLARPAGGEVDGLVVVAERHPAAAVGGLDLRWEVVTLGGRRGRTASCRLQRPPRTSAFVVDLDVDLAAPPGGGATGDAAARTALALLLGGWTLLGMLDRALDLTRRHVLDRQQFGQPLAAFQGVQFQLADAEVERAGAEVLALYALWSLASGQPGVLADTLACRLAMVEAADVVFRAAHQLHGASGFCDETTLSWVSRYSTPLRRLPFGPTGTQVALARAAGRDGLAGLFGAGISAGAGA